MGTGLRLQSTEIDVSIQMGIDHGSIPQSQYRNLSKQPMELRITLSLWRSRFCSPGFEVSSGHSRSKISDFGTTDERTSSLPVESPLSPVLSLVDSTYW
jgi:hypothetical protein